MIITAELLSFLLDSSPMCLRLHSWPIWLFINQQSKLYIIVTFFFFCPPSTKAQTIKKQLTHITPNPPAHFSSCFILQCWLIICCFCLHWRSGYFVVNDDDGSDGDDQDCWLASSQKCTFPTQSGSSSTFWPWLLWAEYLIIRQPKADKTF